MQECFFSSIYPPINFIYTRSNIENLGNNMSDFIILGDYYLPPFLRICLLSIGIWLLVREVLHTFKARNWLGRIFELSFFMVITMLTTLQFLE